MREKQVQLDEVRRQSAPAAPVWGDPGSPRPNERLTRREEAASPFTRLQRANSSVAIHRDAGKKIPFQNSFRVLSAVLACLLVAGCACHRVEKINPEHRFKFSRDSFSFTNELRWVYDYDAQGKWTTHWREPKPTYWQHCFVVARSAKQFFLNARFEPNLPVANEKAYRRLIREVVASSPRSELPADKKIVIPGYADLREFSSAQARLLKEECGGAWRSYVQRGHWRMIFPFSRAHQARTAAHLLEHLRTQDPVVVHIVRFPQLTINHAVVFYDAQDQGGTIAFRIYDPNQPSAPRVITYDKTKRTFFFAASDYFPGGRVDAYEIYSRWNY